MNVKPQKRDFSLTIALSLLIVCVLIQLLGFVGIYVCLVLSFIVGLFCVLRGRFEGFPALVVLYARGSSVQMAILVAAFALVMLLVFRRRMKQLLAFPDILILLLLGWVSSMTLVACLRSGFYWNQAYWAELMAVFGLFAFYYGMHLYGSYSPKGIRLLLAAGLFAFIYEYLSRHIDETSVVRLVFYWGPFFVALLGYSFKKLNIEWIAFAGVGSLFFIMSMLMGYPTLTLQGCSLSAFFMALWLPVVFGRLVVSWAIFGLISLVMVYGVTYIEEQSLARYRGTASVMGEYKLVKFDEEFRDRLQAKFFDDRATLWRAYWEDVIAEPLFWKSLDDRFVRHYTTSQGQELAEFEIPPHNVYIGTLFKMRWIAGPIFLLLYCLMILRAGKVLLLKSADKDIWVVTSATIFCIGVFGGLTGDFPMLSTYNFPFMVLAGLCHAHYLESKRQQVERRGLP